MSRFNLRQKPRISYYEPDEPSLDEYVFCDECGDYVYEYCSIHGPLLVVPDDKPPAVSPYPAVVPRAALTIPRVFLHIARSTIPHAGLGVFTSLTLPRGVRFGPYRGQRVTQADSQYCWQINDRNNRRSHLVDAADPNRSNWMRYVNCSRHWCEQNLVAYQYQGQLYYRTIKIIPRFTELLVFYGSEFANMLHINLKLYSSPRGYPQKLGAPLAKKPKLDSENEILEEKEQGKSEIEKEKNSSSDNTDLPAPIAMQEAKTHKNNQETKTNKTKTLIDNPKDTNNESTQKPEPNKKPKPVQTKTNMKRVDKIILSAPSNPKCDTNNNVDKTVFSNQYICDICNYSTNAVMRLEAHLKAHVASVCFSCDLCSYKTSKRKKIIVHLKTLSAVNDLE